jgi:hypothetical protein
VSRRRGLRDVFVCSYFPLNMKHQLSVASSFVSVLVQLFVILIILSTCCEISET